MRLRINERLRDYNKRNGTKLKLRDLAHIMYDNKDTIDQSKYNRISAINSGKKMATVAELSALQDILGCGCDELIDNDNQKL